MIVPLQDAADWVGCSLRDLLHAGAASEMRLLMARPARAILRLHCPRRVDLGTPALMRIPNLLELRPEHCLALQLQGSVEAFDFPTGYSYSPQTGVRELHPSVCADAEYWHRRDGGRGEFLLGWSSWRVSTEAGETLRISGEQILVTQVELAKWMKHLAPDGTQGPHVNGSPPPEPTLEGSDGYGETKVALGPHQTDLGECSKAAQPLVAIQLEQAEHGRRSHSAKQRWTNATQDELNELEQDRKDMSDFEFEIKWDIKKESARQVLYKKKRAGMDPEKQAATRQPRNGISTMAKTLGTGGKKVSVR